MPVPEGRMRVTPILPQQLIREKLAPLARDGGGPAMTPTRVKCVFVALVHQRVRERARLRAAAG